MAKITVQKLKEAIKSSVWNCTIPLRTLTIMLGVFIAIIIFVNDLGKDDVNKEETSILSRISLRRVVIYIGKFLLSYIPYFIIIVTWLLLFTEDGKCSRGSLTIVYLYTILYYIIIIARNIIVNFTTVSRNWGKFKSDPKSYLTKDVKTDISSIVSK